MDLNGNQVNYQTQGLNNLNNAPDNNHDNQKMQAENNSYTNGK